MAWKIWNRYTETILQLSTLQISITLNMSVNYFSIRLINSNIQIWMPLMQAIPEGVTLLQSNSKPQNIIYKRGSLVLGMASW